MGGFNYGGYGDGTRWSSERGDGPAPGGGTGTGGNGGRGNDTGGSSSTNIDQSKLDPRVSKYFSNPIEQSWLDIYYRTALEWGIGKIPGRYRNAVQAMLDEDKRTVPYSGPIQHKRVIAAPGVWSESIDLLGSTGSEQYPDVYTVNFNPSSNMESSFDVEISYPEANGMKTINTMGPGSYTIKATGVGSAYVRVKSHSNPVAVTFDFPQK